MDSDSVRQQWAERSGEYSPDYYAYYGPNETSELLCARLDSAVESDATILELGCSSGRHLAHLHDEGYENLHGIEINDEALAVMEENYPALAEDGTFYIDAIQDVLPEFDDGQFDVVFSVETLQHLHPDDEWVFGEYARITDRLITVENERKVNDDDGEVDGEEADDDFSSETPVSYVRDEFPLYFRNWNRVFTDRGFTEIHSEPADRDVFREFRVDGGNPASTQS